MPDKTPTKWFIEADYFQACNCDYGCPCEFEAPPTMGYCEGMGAYRITSGKFGDLALDGIGFAFAIHFPAAMHKGNGRGLFIVDEKATPAQRDAMQQIASAEHGGMPFEIFEVILTEKLEPRFAPFEFQQDGRNATVKVGDALAMTFEPIKNPVSGEPESVVLEHGTGFIFKKAECVSAKECRATLGDWTFSYPDKAGFLSKIRYAN